MRFLLIFIFLLSNSFADEVVDIKNLVINKELKKYDGLTFLDAKNNQLNLEDYKGNLILLNFWASWCAPCKEEMPSLNRLQANQKLKNLKIYPINIGKENLKKVKSFFTELDINNLEPYFDNPSTLAKTFSLRGLPTTILLNSKGEEFARIIGSINFDDENFINWLKNLS